MYIEQLPPQKKLFWYRRADGEIFSCGEDEAFLTGRQHETQGGQFLGCSNGSEYRRIMMQAKAEQRDMVTEYKDLKQLATDSNGTVNWNNLTPEDRERSQVLMRDLKKITLKAMRDSENAELEVAKSNMERPRDNRGRDLTGNELPDDMKIGKKYADAEKGQTKVYRDVSEFQISTKDISQQI